MSTVNAVLGPAPMSVFFSEDFEVFGAMEIINWPLPVNDVTFTVAFSAVELTIETVPFAVLEIMTSVAAMFTAEASVYASSNVTESVAFAILADGSPITTAGTLFEIPFTLSTVIELSQLLTKAAAKAKKMTVEILTNPPLLKGIGIILQNLREKRNVIKSIVIS